MTYARALAMLIIMARATPFRTGLEPRSAVLETAVLPLHHRPKILYKRRAQDSNLQALSDQRFSRPLPLHPDTRQIINRKRHCTDCVHTVPVQEISIKYDYIRFNLFLYDTIFFAREEHHCLCEHWRDCLRLDCDLNMVFIAVVLS